MESLQQDTPIFVAGHRGLVGSAIVARLEAGGYTHIITRTRSELDLRDQAQVADFLSSENIGVVIIAAAKVGGILANSTAPADFIGENLIIQHNLIDGAHRAGIGRVLFLGSSCIYPKLAPQPLKEEYLLTGPLEPTNEWYAVAKIAGIKMCEAYRKQHGRAYFSLMPTNLYGPRDNFDLQTSHVLPALIRKFHEAEASGSREVVLWGSGTPRREFLYNADLADAVVHIMELPVEHVFSVAPDGLINVGVGEDVTIRELAETVRTVVGADVEIVLDTTKPDGTPRKLMDVGRLHALGWHHKTDLSEGIAAAYAWYREHLA
jgi:GDP-L-fucose synthase